MVVEKIELMNFYNNKLKLVKTVDDINNLVKEFYNDEKIWNSGVGCLRTKKNHNPINSFFKAYNPLKVEYICDGDSWTRCCKIENIWKFVEFEIR